MGARLGRNNIKVQSGSKSDLAVAPPPQVDLSKGTLGVGGGGQQPGIGFGIRAWVLVWSNSLNTKINRQRGYLDMFPNSCSSLNPKSLKRHTPRNQASALPWWLAQVPLTDPAKGTLPNSGTPFSNLKASTGQDSPSGCAPSPTFSGPRPGGLHSPLHRAIQKSSSENMARARAAPRPPTARAITAAPHSGGLKGAKNGKSRSEWPPFPQEEKKKARSQEGFSASGSNSLGFHGQPQGGESRADTKRAPVALILGEQAPHQRRRAASQS